MIISKVDSFVSQCTSPVFLGMCRKAEVSEPAKESLLKSLEEMPAIVQNPPKRPRHVP